VQILLDRIVANNELPAHEKGLALHCGNSPCIIHSDPALLERVVENFVTNAIRYTDVGHVEVNCIPLGDRVRIEVKDTGFGVPKEALETIFEEYFQLDNPVGDRGNGLGLGLAIVNHLARLLKHPLDVQSTPGEGSVFAVEVPTGLATEAQRDVAPTPTARGRHPVVLFVDDDPAIAEATSMLLESAGIQVHTALDGEQALAHVEAGIRPDLIISDYRLPGDNGVEVARRVRRAMAKDLPVLIMTGDTSGKEIDDAKLTAFTVLHKPSDSERLISLVEELTAASA
jgi:two-component system CheB/CheR fusion protein